MNPERITDAAILFVIDCPYTVIPMVGVRHADIFERAFRQGIKYNKEKTIQGFWTNKDNFLDRYEAKKLAMSNGQLSEDTGLAELFSEDLW